MNLTCSIFNKNHATIQVLMQHRILSFFWRKWILQYRSKVSWQSRLDPRKSILTSWRSRRSSVEKRESRVKDRESRIENWEMRIKFWNIHELESAIYLSWKEQQPFAHHNQLFVDTRYKEAINVAVCCLFSTREIILNNYLTRTETQWVYL